MFWSWLGFPLGFMPAFVALVQGEHRGEPFASGCRLRQGASRVAVRSAKMVVLRFR
jgi:hypothetical protein